MSIPTHNLHTISAEDKKFIDSILNPKIKGDADGNYTVNVKKMQEIHDLLRATMIDVERTKRLARTMLDVATCGKNQRGFDIVEQSRSSSHALQKLTDLTTKFELAFGMNYFNSDHDVVQCLEECKARQAPTGTVDTNDGPALATVIKQPPKEKLTIVINHKDDEEDLYA